MQQQLGQSTEVTNSLQVGQASSRTKQHSKATGKRRKRNVFSNLNMYRVFCSQYQKEKQFGAGAAAPWCCPGDSTLSLHPAGAWHTMAAHGEHQTRCCSKPPPSKPGAPPRGWGDPGDMGMQDPTSCSPPGHSPRLPPGAFHTRTLPPAAKKLQRCRVGAHMLEICQDASAACVSAPPSTATVGISAAAPVGAGSAPGADGGLKIAISPSFWNNPGAAASFCLLTAGFLTLFV